MSFHRNAKLGYEYVRSAAAKTGVAANPSDHGWELLPRTRGKNAKRDYARKDPLSGSKRVRP